jgi:S-adenosyl methyltransferase
MAIMAKLERVPPGVDPNVPSSARVYDYLLGGKDHLAIDREIGGRLLAVAPDTRAVARANRMFLTRAVRHVAARGVKQFLDLGTGIPTSPSVHEVARRVAPEARVVYVDYDPVVQRHAEVLLASEPGLTTLRADLRRPAEILNDPQVIELIDFEQPVGILMVAVLHFVMESESPAGIIKHFRDRMAPGSHLILSHTMAESAPESIRQLSLATAGSPAQSVFRTHEQVLQLFDGFKLIEPGLIPVQDWRVPGDDEPDIPLLDQAPRLRVEGGVGRLEHAHL